MELVPCPECSRHVRNAEAACPFCGTALELAASPPQLLPTQRLSRAELVSFRTLVGAGLLGASTALSGGCDTTNAVAVYGAPCAPPECNVPDAGGASSTGGTSGSGGASSGGVSGNGGNASGGISGSGGASGGSDAGASGAGGDEGAGAGGEGGG